MQSNFFLYIWTLFWFLQLNWVCDNAALPSIAQAIFFCGAILGGLLFGWVADRHGRIPAIVGSNMIGFVAGVATSFCHSFSAFCVCRFLVGMAFDNCFTMMYILGKTFWKKSYYIFDDNYVSFGDIEVTN